MLSKIVNRFTYSPLLPSIKLQSCHSFHENDEEYPEIIQIISELNSLFLLWEQNTVLSTMSEIETFQKSNPITVLSVKNIVSESSGAPLLSMQSNSMSLESSDVSAVTEDYNDIANVDSMIAQQLVANVSLLTSYSTTGALKNPSEFNLLTRSTSLPPDSSTLSPLPSPRSSKKPNLKKKDGKKDSNAASAPKKKKKVPSTKTKSQTNIPTHGSIKIEMVPQCHLAKIEGLSEYDKVISNALYQINGIGYGFMFGGSTEMDRSHINPDNPDEYTDEYLDRLNSLKKQLQETETTLVPIYDDLNQLPLSIISNQHRNIHGTLLSLYLTLCQLCFQLNHRKETNLYIEKYIKYCETHLHGDIHHLAIGYRLQLDMEEWMVSATLSSMISQQKLKRYQELLLMVKKYYQLTERIQHVDCELYFDAWKRLINVYADISTVPDTPGTPKPPSTETLMENLSLLTPDEIDQLEETDLGWLKLYSRIRAKSLATKLTVAMKSKYNDLMKSEEESAIVGGDGAAGG